MKTSVQRIAAALMIGTAVIASPAVMHRAQAQSNTASNIIPKSEEVTVQAKIKKIDTATREVTLKGADGQVVKITAGPLVRLNLLKAGDTVNVQYYRSVAFFVQKPTGGNGTPTSNDQFAAAMARPVQAPGGVAVSLQQISGTVVGIDLSSNTLDIVNPSGGMIYRIDVTDPARQALLGTLSIGDTVTAAISQQLAISITPAKKSFWNFLD